MVYRLINHAGCWQNTRGTREEFEFFEFSANIPSGLSALYNNQINARALIGQSAMVYCAINPWKKRTASELLYKSNRPQVSMVYRLWFLGCW